MTHVEKARKLFLQGANCSQAIFGAFSDVTGIDEVASAKLSSSFGGGMGRMREVCGAVSGMFLVIGILYGYTDFQDNEAKKAHYALVQRLAREFKERNETIICRELLASLHPSDSADPTPRSDDFYKTRPCLRFVETAAEILDELLKEKENETLHTENKSGTIL